MHPYTCFLSSMGIITIKSWLTGRTWISSTCKSRTLSTPARTLAQWETPNMYYCTYYNYRIAKIITITSIKNNWIKFKDEVGMAMPKSIQTRFVGIRDNHNHYTSLRLLFSIITDLLMLTCSRHAILGVFLTCMWKKFMFSLSVSF